MKPFYLFIIYFLLADSSCKNDDTMETQFFKHINRPVIPESKMYDFNNDSVEDFAVKYPSFIWDGVNSSGFGYYGQIDPLNQNLILYKRDAELHSLILFNQVNDTIEMEVNEPLEWEASSARIIEIYGSGQNVWPNEWNIRSETKEPYYIGIKLKTNDSSLDLAIGWIKLEIDKSTGEVGIVDFKLTEEKLITIDK